MRRLLFLSAALLAAMLAPPLVPSLALAQESPPAAGFPAWLAGYRADAAARGLAPEWLDRALADVRYTPRVVDLDRQQPDDSGARNIFADYLARQLTRERISTGQARAAANRAALLRIGAETGVAPEIIAGIWGMETSYGRVLGGFDLPSAIATLAYDGRRARLFTGELDALVRLVGEQGIPRQQLKGSWAGAFGQAQFLPSSFLAYAKDGDGDGRIDLWNSTADAFASIGHYLASHGWRPGIPWGFRAGLPRDFDRASVANPVKPTSCIRPLERHSRWLTVAEWKAMGVRPLNAFWPADEVEMSLVEPDGAEGDAYLATRNYRALMEYNCSNFYALSVALLGDALQSALRP